jgi:hypothetical protein
MAYNYLITGKYRDGMSPKLFLTVIYEKLVEKGVLQNCNPQEIRAKGFVLNYNNQQCQINYPETGVSEFTCNDQEALAFLQNSIENARLEMNVLPHELSKVSLIVRDDILKDNNHRLSISKDSFDDLDFIHKNKRLLKIKETLQQKIESRELNVNSIDKEGSNLLYLAIRENFFETAIMLLENGADPFMKNIFGTTPLDSLNSKKRISDKDTEAYEDLRRIIIEKNNLKEVIFDKRSQKDKSIAAKKARILQKQDYIQESQELSEEELITWREKILDGAKINRNNAQFEKVDGKIFLKKPDGAIESKFGSDMFRILSNGKYAAKREVLKKQENGAIKHSIKFDDNLEATFLDAKLQTLPNFNISSPQNQDFLKGYARMCGVMHVLGESDLNPYNFLRSKKTGRPVKIDNGFIVNYIPPFNKAYAESNLYKIEKNKRFRIYGSGQSKDFLSVILAGQKQIDSHDKILQNKSVLSVKNEQSLENFAQVMINAYNIGIDDSLLNAIKERISNDDSLKNLFTEFMSGVRDAIELANDDEFLNQYVQTKFGEFGEESLLLANQCKEFFKENAAQAQRQFGRYLQYYREISGNNFLDLKTQEDTILQPSDVGAATENAQIRRESGRGPVLAQSNVTGKRRQDFNRHFNETENNESEYEAESESEDDYIDVQSSKNKKTNKKKVLFSETNEEEKIISENYKRNRNSQAELEKIRLKTEESIKQERLSAQAQAILQAEAEAAQLASQAQYLRQAEYEKLLQSAAAQAQAQAQAQATTTTATFHQQQAEPQVIPLNRKIPNTNLNLNLYNQTLTNNQKPADEQKFQFSSLDEEENTETFVDKVTNCITNAIKSADVGSELFAYRTILLAIKNDGISNAKNKQQLSDDFKILFEREMKEEDLRKMQKFSYRFQKEAGILGLYTGREDKAKIVPLRLKRLNPFLLIQVIYKKYQLNSLHDHAERKAGVIGNIEGDMVEKICAILMKRETPENVILDFAMQDVKNPPKKEIAHKGVHYKEEFIEGFQYEYESSNDPYDSSANYSPSSVAIPVYSEQLSPHQKSQDLNQSN